MSKEGNKGTGIGGRPPGVIPNPARNETESLLREILDEMKKQTRILEASKPLRGDL